jgi:hypothetical protein
LGRIYSGGRGGPVMGPRGSNHNHHGLVKTGVTR